MAFQTKGTGVEVERQTLKVELIELFKGLDAGYEIKRGVKDDCN